MTEAGEGRRMRVRGPLVVATVLILANGFVAYWLTSIDPRESGGDLLHGRAFVDAIIVGNQELPDRDGITGFEAAWDMLSSRKRDAVGLGAFTLRFVRLSDVNGYLESARRSAGEGGSSRRRELYYELRFSGKEGRVVVMRLELVLVGANEDYMIDDFDVTAMDEEDR